MLSASFVSYTRLSLDFNKPLRFYFLSANRRLNLAGWCGLERVPGNTVVGDALLIPLIYCVRGDWAGWSAGKGETC